MNLNASEIPTDSAMTESLKDYSIELGNVSVYFRDIEKKLIEHISKASVVVGVVAWMTNQRILNALKNVGGVSIIVQKEDFLRPDVGATGSWRRTLRNSYEAIRGNLYRMDFQDTVLNEMSVCCDPSIEAVRCVGNYNRDKTPAFPRAHDKFLVFCRSEEKGEHQYCSLKPYAVWTGSYNFTANAAMSFENAVMIWDPVISMAYLKEFAQIAALSEPLDWDSDWVAPEWRIGT